MVFNRVRVDLAERSYDVVVGHGAKSELGNLIPKSAKRAVVITQDNIGFKVETGLPTTTINIGSGEEHKTLQVIADLSSEFAKIGLTRGDVIIGVGGGMVTDVAGFAAASWHRGTAVVHVATTLVGMVDAAIGGKTGVNLPEGKNLVGAFWQPSGVICDLDALATLPESEMRCGFGEMAKYHFLTGDDLLALDQAGRVARCAQIKAQIVSVDEREGGGRAVLNYGHTLGHAVEISTKFAVAHGQAVAIGMIFAAHLARVLGRISSDRVAQHYAVIGGAYGLETKLPLGCKIDEVIDLMAGDKKALNGLTFVLDGAAGIELVQAVSRENVVKAFESMQVI